MSSRPNPLRRMAMARSSQAAVLVMSARRHPPDPPQVRREVRSVGKGSTRAGMGWTPGVLMMRAKGERAYGSRVRGAARAAPNSSTAGERHRPRRHDGISVSPLVQADGRIESHQGCTRSGYFPDSEDKPFIQRVVMVSIEISVGPFPEPGVPAPPANGAEVPDNSFPIAPYRSRFPEKDKQCLIHASCLWL